MLIKDTNPKYEHQLDLNKRFNVILFYVISFYKRTNNVNFGNIILVGNVFALDILA